MVMTALVIIEPGALSEVVAVVIEPSSTMMAAILLKPTTVLMWGSSNRGCSRRGRVALVRRRRIWAWTLRRAVGLRRVPSVHWSIGVPRRSIVKPHPDWWSHGLRFGRAVMSSTATATSILLVMGLVRGRVRGRGSWSTPLLRRTTWRLGGSIRLPIGLWWRGSICRLLLLLRWWWLLLTVGLLLLLLLLMIEVLSVVGMVILRRQSVGTRGMMLVSLIRPLLWWLLRSLGISARTCLRMLSRVLSRVLRAVWLWLVLRRLLRVVSVWARSLVVGSATCLRVVIPSASSSRVATTTTLALVWRILWVATSRWRGRGRSRRRRAVIIGHDGSPSCLSSKLLCRQTVGNLGD